MRRPAVLVSAASFLIALACHDAAGPRARGAEAGLYLAQSVDGRPLPAVLDSGAVGFTVLDADSVALDGFGQAVRATTSHRVTASGSQSVHTHTTAEYRLDGEHIEIGRFQRCPDNADCYPNENGVLRGTALSLARFGPAHTEFARVLNPELD